MSLINGSIPNLINGISQQPPTVRLPTQGERQVNAISSVVRGLIKRPPTQHLKKLISGTVSGAHVHVINRDANEQYVCVVTNGDIKVFDLQGNPKTVNFEAGADTYLMTATPRQDISMVTVADYTFLTNRNTAVAVQDNGPPANSMLKEGLVYVKQGDYGTDYKVYVDGTQRAAYTTSTTDRATTQTDHIASQLYSQLNSNLPSNITATLSGNVIRLRGTSSAVDFIIRTEDSSGGYHLKGLKGKVQNFSDLPFRAFEGFTIKVSGAEGVEADDYYVTYTETDGSGVWKESIKKDLDKELDAATMPHALIRESDGTFTFGPTYWDKRSVGDENMAPDPSFVGRKINDIFFHRNRLGVLADENVIFSAASEYFNFYPATVISELDSHPIDVSISNDKVSILRYAVSFNEALVFFSDLTQFTLGSTEILSPAQVSIDVSTQFEASLLTKPIGAGKNIYFPVSRGGFGAIREYFVDVDTETKDAADINGHCPEYLKGTVTTLAASSNEDILFCTTDQNPTGMYVYSYYWKGNEKVQSSWSEWDIGGEVLGMSFIESRLYVVVQRSDGVYLEVVDLASGDEEINAGFKSVVNLDRRIYKPAGSSTFPYDLTNAVAVDKKGRVWSGTTAINDALVTEDVYIGFPYEFLYEFSEMVMREGEGGASPVTSGRLQLRNMTLVYDKTGYFEVHVTPKARATNKHTFNGRILGSILNKLNEVPIESGTFRFPLFSKADQVTIEVKSSSHLPVALQSAEWEGFYHSRSYRR